MSEYIEVPIETDPEELAQEAFGFVQSTIPDWVPNDANLETIIIEACAMIAAEAREVASAVPNDIFRYFGKLIDVMPKEASFATANTDWTMVDSDGYTIPQGTQVGIRTAGDTLIAFSTVVEHIILPGDTTALDVEIQAVEPGDESSGLNGDIELLDTLDFVDTITLDQDTKGGADEETDEDYLNRLVTRLQLLTPRPILPRDFSILAQDISGVERACTIDLYNVAHNLLSANESSIETSITGWAVNANCTLLQETVQAAHGTKSLRLTSVAAGDMSASVSVYPATNNEQFTATAEFRKSTAGTRSCQVLLQWLNSGMGVISTSAGSTVFDSNTGWTMAYVTSTSPYTTAFVKVIVVVQGTGAASEIHYVDKIALRRGANTTWSIGGTPTDVDRSVMVAVVDADGMPCSSIVKQEVDDYLQSMREVNFVVEVVDATYTTIDVTFTATARPGFDLLSTQSEVVTALTDYLDPKNWGLPQLVGQFDTDRAIPYWENKKVVRYLELSQVINEVSGIDYVDTLSLRVPAGLYDTADITLGGETPMPLPGAISGTVAAP